MTMKVTTSDRGFKSLEPITDAHGGTVKVYESSAAISPHIWVTIEGVEGVSDSCLTLEQAEELINQLRYLIDNHWQKSEERK